MKNLVLDPQPSALVYSILETGSEEPVEAGRLDPFDPHEVKPQDLVAQLCPELLADEQTQPGVVAIVCPFGGSLFAGPAHVTEETLEKLEGLIPFAPLHLPALIALARCCKEAFVGVPIVIVLETSFFTTLPPYERCYGLASGAMPRSPHSRFGFHGIFHAAACQSAIQNLEQESASWPCRIISICLESRPEIAAVMGDRPMMVTSGATPLEGLPGHTTCGDLDPSIVLTLADKLHWGPEQINGALTVESGLLGLTGAPMTMASLWEGGSSNGHLAREVVKHRILQACGACIAALGTVDAIVFSGQFAASGNTLGPWLVSRLESLPGLTENPPTWSCFNRPLDRIVAELAALAVL